MHAESDVHSDICCNFAYETIHPNRKKENGSQHGTFDCTLGFDYDRYTGILPIQIYVPGVLFMACSDRRIYSRVMLYELEAKYQGIKTE